MMREIYSQFTFLEVFFSEAEESSISPLVEPRMFYGG